jgi:DNA repair protein RadC
LLQNPLSFSQYFVDILVQNFLFNPSESDQKITNKIKEAGNLLDIQLLDHIIITTEREIYRSFADEGHL